jgi:hypothetical protein
MDDPPENALCGQGVHVACGAGDDDSAIGADRRPLENVLAADLEAPLHNARIRSGRRAGVGSNGCGGSGDEK